jgi:glycosyltransferase involved in cell wall biosynthesis
VTALAPAPSDAPGAPVTQPGALVVDARAVHESGIGRYARELIAAWRRQPPFERLVLLGDPAKLEALAALDGPGALEVVTHRGGQYSAASQRSWLEVRRLATVRGARACFFPHWDVPMLRLPRRAVVTVHDLTHLRVPHAFSPIKTVVAGAILRRVAARAARIVCVSHATARDVADEFPRAAPRLRVVHNGVTARFAESAGPAPLEGPYLLAVGNQKPHKNLVSAVRVLARLRAEGHPTLRLLVAGRQFDARDGVLAMARDAGVGDAVVSLGEAGDATLHAAYAGCAAFVFPSRHEGFGLPLLEAMLAGAPVVASSTPAVAEVVGDAAPTFDPDDVAGMAAATRRLLEVPAARAEAVARGRRRAREFTWERAARETGRVLQEVAGVLPGEPGPVNLGA